LSIFKAAEVAEAIRDKLGANEVMKECGDVIWYVTGLLLSINIPLGSLVGEKFEELGSAPVDAAQDERDIVMSLMLGVGSLAGRLKKYERGDFGKEKLATFVKNLAPEVLTSLCALLKRRDSGLQQACEANITKIDSRAAQGKIKGDGSNREEEAPTKAPTMAPTMAPGSAMQKSATSSSQVRETFVVAWLRCSSRPHAFHTRHCSH
jgi:hypothetical protein